MERGSPSKCTRRSLVESLHFPALDGYFQYATPNPSFKRTRHGKPRLAFISFSAKRGSPRRSA